jgi:hypothetical protein
VKVKFRRHRRYEVSKGGLISPQKPVQLGFQGAPAAADFDGFDAAFGNVFKVGGAGNLKVHTGLFGGIYDLLAVIIKSVDVAAIASVKTAASVGFFASIIATSALHDVIIYHKYHLMFFEYRKILLAFYSLLVSANHRFFFKYFWPGWDI